MGSHHDTNPGPQNSTTAEVKLIQNKQGHKKVFNDFSGGCVTLIYNFMLKTNSLKNLPSNHLRGLIPTQSSLVYFCEVIPRNMMESTFRLNLSIYRGAIIID